MLDLQALAVLSAFVHPRTVRDVLGGLKSQLVSVHEWMSLTQTIHDLIRAGALVHAEQTPKLAPTGFSYSGARVHTRMLNDAERTHAYVAAIRAVVKPGDTVVDLGTGSGILAVAAAQAGARRVYAIEASAIADLAQRVFAANGVADRVTLLRGWSSTIELPERADVLVSELLGNDPFEERILEITEDARKRFLTPQARLVPRALTVGLRLLAIPNAELDARAFTPANLERWMQTYGVDFSALASVEPNDTERFTVKSGQTLGWTSLSEPVRLTWIDLTSHAGARVDAGVDVECSLGGIVNGVLLYSELDLADGFSISTDPYVAAETCHWRPYVYRLQPPLTVKPRDRVRVHYRYRAIGKTLEATAL